jgi:polyisoprenoid-binding protein YceI
MDLDSDHSVAGFVIEHMMVTNMRGQFNEITGRIHFDLSDITHSSMGAVIYVSGIYTGIQKRDDLLRSTDFFDVSKYPKLLF